MQLFHLAILQQTRKFSFYGQKCEIFVTEAQNKPFKIFNTLSL